MQGEELLLSRARKGDPAAFEQLAAPLERQVYFTCLRLVSDPERAKDCAQEAMLRAFRGIRAYRGESRFATWMYKITYSACLDELRRLKRRPAESLEEMGEAGFTPADTAPTPYEALEKKERLEKLTAAIAALPPELREVLVLSNLQNRSYEEIAQITGAALGTVKSRLNRAREKLKQLLSPQRELFSSSGVQISEGRASE